MTVRLAEASEMAALNDTLVGRVKVLIERAQEDLSYLLGKDKAQGDLCDNSAQVAHKTLAYTIEALKELVGNITPLEERILFLEKQICMLSNPDMHDPSNPVMHHPCIRSHHVEEVEGKWVLKKDWEDLT